MSAHEYILKGVSFTALSPAVIAGHSSAESYNGRDFPEIIPDAIEVNAASFHIPSAVIDFPAVGLSQEKNMISLSCECQSTGTTLCEHQVHVLYQVMERTSLRIFFDESLRDEKLRQVAKDYGLEKEQRLDEFFSVEYNGRSFDIKPKIKELFPLNQSGALYLKEQLLPRTNVPLSASKNPVENTRMILVLSRHKYYDRLNTELYEVQVSKEGKVKNPLVPVDPLTRIWKTTQVEEVKFYSSVSAFQHNYVSNDIVSDLEGLKALIANPSGLEVYSHDPSVSEKITAASVSPVKLEALGTDLHLSVDLRGDFYEVSGTLMVKDTSYELKMLKVQYTYFVRIGDTMYLVANPDFLRVIDFFKKNNQKILVHRQKYDEFYQSVLSKLEHHIRIRYSYVKPATPEQIEEQGFGRPTEKIIYLSENEHFISIMPVIRYGNMEVPVLSKKQIHDTDQNGNVFMVERDDEMEFGFISVLLRQHNDFNEQLNQGDSFYLHKKRFMDENWFLDAFEAWYEEGILVLGFDELKDNKLNPNKAVVTIHVNSGIDWFNTALAVQYGKRKATLKQLHKSIRNKSKYVQLDDGTLGILPQEWMEKFALYFQAGEIMGEEIRTPKSNFADVSMLYEHDMLSQQVKQELELYESKFSHFETIEEVAVPQGLQATLRDYQKQGLNWLNFLDEFNFGGCLADDMGLGKTIQVIAFMLLLRAKQKQNTNLVVVPTSLLFNWQEELAKFAPSLKVFTHYGADRIRTNKQFDQYEVILTTYGMLLSDISFLKEYRFNYVFLDESQAIKNPESQRYKAARMLQARNRIVLTGTPVENNTFDIYGQLSFACPGLLGNKQYFKDIYLKPIDQFEDRRRTAELRKKISPFILRRTKRQVTPELPDKTEMVIYCEMGAEQRRVYEENEKEFRDYLLTKTEEDIRKSSMYVLKGITRLRQICDSPSLLKGETFSGDVSAKIAVLMEQIENKSSKHKILVFSQFVSMLELIKKELEQRNISFEYLTGQTTNRASKVHAFQKDEEVRVFLISLKAGGVGLNLTEADYVYLVDPWWNPAVEDQAIDRCYRIGQKKNVIAVRLICPDTIEEKIMKLQATKTELVNDLVKTDTAILKSLSKKDLLGLLKS